MKGRAEERNIVYKSQIKDNMEKRHQDEGKKDRTRKNCMKRRKPSGKCQKRENREDTEGKGQMKRKDMITYNILINITF